MYRLQASLIHLASPSRTHLLAQIHTKLPIARMSTVHQVANRGFAEGTNDLYDAARPTYPSSAVHRIRSALPSPANGKGYRILEAGSGTGIFTRVLLSPPTPEYPSFPIDTLVAVEPSAGMRATWQKSLEAKVPKESLEGKDVRTVEGTFDDFSKSGLEVGSVDFVVIAQAWHWCPDHDKALREIAKYLTPTGSFILIWNIEANTDSYHTELRKLYQPLDLGSPQYYKQLWRSMFDVPVYGELFEPPVENKDAWALGLTEEQLVSRLFSASYLTEAHLSGEKRVQFEKEVRRIIREGEHTWVNKDAGVFLYKYNTDTLVIRKKAPSS